MSIRNRTFELTSPEEVNEFLNRYPTSAIFKAGGCHKTMEGFGHVEGAMNQCPDLHMGFIRVIESRPASSHVESLTGIKHESPQFIVFVDGEAKFDVDNWEITPEVVEAALEEFADAIEVKADASDLTVYTDLLEKYVGGSMPEEEFEASWSDVFRNDSSPRSTEEFQAINSLFGGIGPLRDRASNLLKLLLASS